MKKRIACLLLLLITSSFTITSNAVVDPDFNYLYQTSYGSTFYLGDYDVYLEDFADTDFESSQEVVDHIYQVGSSRTNSRSGYIDDLGYKLTEAELALMIEHPIYVLLAYLAYEITITETEALYPDTHLSDGAVSNAFRHAYWTIMLCKYTSPTFAIDFVTAHEEYDGNVELHKSMDLYNNSVAHTYYTSNNINGVQYSNAQLSSTVQNMIGNGDLIYIVFDYEYVAKIIYYEETGVTIRKTATGDFYAYTNSTTPYNLPTPIRVVIPSDSDLPVLTPQSTGSNATI